MRPSEALDFIRKTFNDPSNTIEISNHIPEQTYIEVLESPEIRLPYKDGATGMAICQFLFCGCIKFDRWVVPIPYVFNPDNRQHFDRFVNALKISEKDTRNVARFLADQIKWDLYDEFDYFSPVKLEQMSDFLTKSEEKLDSIEPPSLKH